MSYAFLPHETLDEAARRLAGDQIDAALAALGDLEHDHDEQIHEARQCLKRLRALLRLFAPELGRSTVRRENEAFRDAARELAGAREAAAAIESLDHVLDELDASARQRFQPIRQRLIAARNDQAASAIAKGSVSRAERLLGDARSRIASWPDLSNRMRALAGLRRTYRNGRRAMRRAEREPTGSNLHEWRKLEKQHFYHMRLLEPMFQQELGARAKALHHLSDLLGDLHDLDLLRELLSGIDRTSEPSTGVEQRALVSTLRLLIDFRALFLRRQAFSLGRRLYAEKPKALERRFACFFEAWRADSKPAFSAAEPTAAALATARSVTTN